MKALKFIRLLGVSIFISIMMASVVSANDYDKDDCETNNCSIYQPVRPKDWDNLDIIAL